MKRALLCLLLAATPLAELVQGTADAPAWHGTDARAAADGGVPARIGLTPWQALKGIR